MVERYLFLFLFLFLNFLLKAQWILVFEDNFDGTTLDTSKWYNTQPWGQYPPDKLPVIFLPENVSVHNGYLWLTLKKDSNTYFVPNLGGNFTYRYSAGMVWSKKLFKYGIFEAKIKIPNERGVWSAFWLYGSALYGDEIDIFEQYWPKINKNKVNLKSTIHHSNKQISDDNIYKRSFLDQWHTYKLKWNDNKIEIYFDNKLVSDFKKNNNGNAYNTLAGNILGHTVKYPENAENVILNISVHKDFSPSNLPQTMFVDYIRVWQKQNCNDLVTICNYNAKFDNNVFTGRIIEAGGNGCNVVVNENEYLDLLATQEIHLKPGFSVKKGGNFVAKIVPCSSYKFYEEIEKNDTSKESRNFDVNTITYDEINHNKSDYEIFPNPFNECINVSINEIEDSYIVVYDLLGNIRYYEKIYKCDQKINLTHLEKGVYIIKLIINRNNVYYEKVVKI